MSRHNWHKLILPELLQRELGKSDWKQDRGGRTVHGITEETADRLGLDLETLDERGAMDAYYGEYYIDPGFDQLRDIRLSWRMTLDGLHSGPGSVTRRLQELCNFKTNGAQDIKVDGLLGPLTGAAISYSIEAIMKEFSSRGFESAYDRAIWDFCSQLKALQFSHYRQIIRNDPTQEFWFNGWCNRIRFEPSWYVETYS